MTISFNEIPTTLRVPFAYAEFDPSGATQGPSLMPYSVLVLGGMLSTGTADPYEVKRPMSKKQADEWFGQGSMASQMVEGYLGSNIVTEMYCIGIPDADVGVKATATLTMTGQVTAAAPVECYIGGVRVRASAIYDMTAEAIATALALAVNANLDLAVTASATGGVVTFTAKHAGEQGNDIDIRLSYYDEPLPSGITFAIAPMSGGAGNPDMSEAIAAMGSDWYHLIAMPYTDEFNYALLRDELEDRWGPLRQIGGQAITVKTGTFGEVVTFTEGRNDKSLTVIPSENSPTLSWVDAAVCMGVVAYYANSDPARGFNTLLCDGVLPPKEADRWASFPEKNQALFEGISTRYVAADGTVRLQKLITTYRLSPLGAETRAYLSLNSPLTLTYLRYDWNNYLADKYPRHKLAGDTDANRYDPSQPIMTPKLGKAEAISRFMDVWLPLGLVEGSEQFKESIMCERNAYNENRLDWFLQPDLMNQFEVAGTKFQHLV